MLERKRQGEGRDPNILGEQVIFDEGGVRIIRDWERKPTSYFDRPVNGYTGKEYIQDHRAIKPVVIVTVAGS